MEIVIIAAVVIGAVGWWIWKEGKYVGDQHPLEGVTKPIEPYPFPVSRPEEGESRTTKPDGIGHESVTAKPTQTNVLDVNKDGKVDLQDAVVAVTKAKEKTKKAAKKAKAKVEEVVETVKKPKKTKK